MNVFFKKNRNNLFSKKKGFSLIEIMLYMGIATAMLLGVVRLTRMVTDQSKKSNTKTILLAVKTGIEQFNNDLSRYPSKIDEIVHPPSDAKEKRRWAGPYVPSEYIKDGSVKDDYGNDIEYKLAQNKSSFELYSWGKDGQGAATGNIFVD